MTRPDPPGVCTCDALPAGHNDDQCAMEAWRRTRRRCWCGQTVTPSSACRCCCLDHEYTGEAS